MNDQIFKTEIELYYDLHIPEGAKDAPLLISVHGYGAHKRYMIREAKAVAPDNFVIAAPQAPHQHFRKTDDGYRIGFGWLTDHKPEQYVALHQNFLLNIIERLTSDGTVDPGRIYLYGFSQACALNFKFAFTHPEVLRGVIAVCGGIPGDLDTNTNYRPFNADTLYLYGNDDEFYTNEKFKEFDTRLAALLPNFESKQVEATHEITEDMRLVIRKFLASA